MYSILDLAALLLSLSAFFGWLTHELLPFPRSSGLLVMSVLTSLAPVAVDVVLPQANIFEADNGTTADRL